MLEMALMSAACSTNVLSLVTGAFPDAFNWVLNISNSGESNSPKNLFMSWLVAVAVTDAVGVAALCLNQAFTVGACGALGSFGAEGEAPEACVAIGCCEVFFPPRLDLRTCILWRSYLYCWRIKQVNTILQVHSTTSHITLHVWTSVNGRDGATQRPSRLGNGKSRRVVLNMENASFYK